MKAVIIANPTAGKEKASVYQEELKLELSKRYDEVIIHETAKEGDATRLAVEEASADLIVAVGGDGTLSEVINGIAPLDVRPTIAFIPLGTVNEFARALNMPLIPEEVIRDILLYKPRQIDLGHIGAQYFTNSVTVGTIPEAMHDVSSEAKTVFGSLAFVAKGVQMLAKNEDYHFRIQYDEHEWHGEASIVLVGLTSYIAGLEHFFPEAAPDDGSMHVMIVPELGFKDALKMAPDLWQGKIKESEHVQMFTCKRLHIEAEEALTTNVNGDPGPQLPADIVVMKRYLTVLAP